MIKFTGPGQLYFFDKTPHLGTGLRQRSRLPPKTHLSPLAKKASNSAAILQDRAGWLCSAEQLVTTRWDPE